MNDVPESLAEQLSAFMDGELPEAQARFLLRRLEHDNELRAMWSRMHLAAACLKAQPVLPAATRLCADVHEALQASPVLAPVSMARKPAVRWAVAASVLALAVLFAPRMLQEEAGEAAVAGTTVFPQRGIVPSPSSADLVAVQADDLSAREATGPVDAGNRGDFNAALVASQSPQSQASTPMPIDVQSPADFPLADDDKRSWPRSALIGASGAPALEAYLVRHNQMLANDGLGGFVPYVDVVANERAAAEPAEGEASQADANPASGEAESQ